jgi:prepilin-type N-terminal cleavage/methylation domain-containing protein
MRKNRAFTLVEVVIVIVIFGIIATIGANIIARMYMNYMQARTVNYIQTQSGIVLEQIAKRLQYRVKASIVALNTHPGATPPTLLRLDDERVDEDFNVIQWIGYSNEALLNNASVPGWSGFIDMDNTTTNATAKTLSTPGSNLGDAETMMSILSNNTVTLAGTKSAALIFKGLPPDSDIAPEVGYGWDGNGGDSKYMITVTRRNNTSFDVTSANPVNIYEHYYLAHSAYALVPNIACGAGCSDTNFTLELRYNYQPWSATLANRSFLTASSAILATNVNLFRIKQTGSTIRLKLCLHDGGQSGLGNATKPVIACKEEVVL